MGIPATLKARQGFTAGALAVAALAYTGHPDLALAFAIPAFAWLQTTATHKATVAATTAARVEQAIGPTNGQDIAGLLAQLVRLDHYTHDRNHDLLTAGTPGNATLYLVLLAVADHLGVAVAPEAAPEAVLGALCERLGVPTPDVAGGRHG